MQVATERHARFIRQRKKPDFSAFHWLRGQDLNLAGIGRLGLLENEIVLSEFALRLGEDAEGA